MYVNDIMDEELESRLCELEEQALEIRKITNKMKAHIIEAVKPTNTVFIECYNSLSELTEIG